MRLMRKNTAQMLSVNWNVLFSLKSLIQSGWAHIDDMDELKKVSVFVLSVRKTLLLSIDMRVLKWFDAMVEAIREDTIRMLLTVKLRKDVMPQREQVQKPDAPNAGAGDGSFSGEARSKKIGDNDPCPCGSGKKYKKCCGMNKE